METITGKTLISTRPFAVTQCSARLVSNESPVSQAPRPVVLKSATISYGVPCRRLLRESKQKTLGLQNPSFLNFMGSLNKRAGMSSYGQVWSATSGQ